MSNTWLYIVLFAVSLVACNRSGVLSASDFQLEMENSIKVKNTKLFKLKLQYLPHDYLVYKELGGLSVDQKSLDSLRKTYQDSWTFKLTIDPVDITDFDITWMNVANYEEYCDRIYSLAFEIKEMIVLSSAGIKLYPSLMNFERSYGLKKSRDFILVFERPENFEEKMSFSFIDEIFETGISKFGFKKQEIVGFPRLAFNIKN